ncbi:MAG: hypothetical protein GTN78_25475 [Gemmatimonadales bacterium]|nr:hypothetical protein [Gemmatimonadales bacterium]NIR03507.1 hypothetical protein [Gemmatimonadales bacterium]
MSRLTMMLLFLAVPSLAAAQEPLVRRTIPAGTVVRFHLADSTYHSGKLLAPFGPDSLRFDYCLYPAPPCRAGGPTYRELLAEHVRGLHLHRGTHAGIGALVGAGLGTAAFVTLLAVADHGCFPDAPSTGVRIASCGAAWGVLAAIPAGIGALLGAVFHRWEPALERAP